MIINFYNHKFYLPDITLFQWAIYKQTYSYQGIMAHFQGEPQLVIHPLRRWMRPPRRLLKESLWEEKPFTYKWLLFLPATFSRNGDKSFPKVLNFWKATIS